MSADAALATAPLCQTVDCPTLAAAPEGSRVLSSRLLSSPPSLSIHPPALCACPCLLLSSFQGARITSLRHWEISASHPQLSRLDSLLSSDTFSSFPALVFSYPHRDFACFRGRAEGSVGGWLTLGVAGEDRASCGKDDIVLALASMLTPVRGCSCWAN